MSENAPNITNYASKGGQARARRLSPEERQQIARRAVQARWQKAGKAPVYQATHEGSIEIGDKKIACAVLNATSDGGHRRRVLTQGTFYQAIGRSRTPKGGTGVLTTVDSTPFFLQAEVLKPFISKDLIMSTAPVFYDDKTGRRMVGYDAELLPMVAEVYLQMRDAFARDHKPVPKQYKHIVQACDILMRGLARIGIVALVDEATGYERDKQQRDLAKILEAFVAKELQPWIKTFPLDFYEMICELRDEPLERAKKRPRYFGRITNEIIYRRLAPGVLDVLRKRNPVSESGHRKHKHFQHLTPETGHPKLKEHLAGVKTTMRLAKAQGEDWNGFLKMLDITHPRYQPMPLFETINGEELNEKPDVG